MIDVFLKLTGTDAQAIAALRTLGIDKEMLRDKGQGQPNIESVYNHDVAVNFIPNLITKFATHDEEGNELTPAEFDGPHMMVRFVSRRMNDIAAQKIVGHALPAGLGVVPNPGTIEWA